METVKKFFVIFDKKTKIKIVTLFVAIVFGAFLEMATLALISPFLSVLLDSEAVYHDATIHQVFELLGFTSSSAFLGLLATLLCSIYFIRGIYMYLLNRKKFYFLSKSQVSISKSLLEKTLGFSYLYHTKHNLAQLQRIISGDVIQLILVVTAFLRFSTDFFAIVAILIYLLITSPVMTLIVMGLAIVCLIIYLKIFRKKVRIAGEQSRKSIVQMEKAIIQALGGIKEVKIAQKESHFSHLFAQHSDEFVEANTLYKSLETVPKQVIETVCFGGAFLILGIFILLGTDMYALVPQLGLFVVAAFRLLPAVSRLATYVNIILFNKPSIDAVHDSLFENETEKQHTKVPVLSASKKNEGIVIDQISFKYPGSSVYIFKDVSFEIPEKKSIAFVGPSGSGKSTMIDLILGILSPLEGGVFYGGKSIHHHFEKWSQNIGYIPQQIYLLDDSIRNNVAFGVSKQDIDDHKVWQALQEAQLKEFVEMLPEGLETVIGDRGIRLSGGQRQRIGIARALYEDPPILVMDEATSALDHETEKAVMEAVVGFQGRKTMIIVAHRLSTIAHCDIVYRVKNHIVVAEKKE